MQKIIQGLQKNWVDFYHRKTRLRQREREATEKALVERFQKVSEVALFENSTIASTGEEERNLIQRSHILYFTSN